MLLVIDTEQDIDWQCVCLELRKHYRTLQSLAEQAA